MNPLDPLLLADERQDELEASQRGETYLAQPYKGDAVTAFGLYAVSFGAILMVLGLVAIVISGRLKRVKV